MRWHSCQYHGVGDACDWVVRDAVRDDEPCIVSMWIKQLVKGPDAKQTRGRGATPRWRDDEFLAYYATMQPIVEAIFRAGLTVKVACDPERVHATPGRPSVILAWSVVDGTALYGVGIDTSFKKGGFAPDLARAVLGDALQKRMRMRLDVCDIGRPAIWVRDQGWQTSLRKASERKLLVEAVFGPGYRAAMPDWIAESEHAQDPVYAKVMQHIYDSERRPWKPREARAA